MIDGLISVEEYVVCVFVKLIQLWVFLDGHLFDVSIAALMIVLALGLVLVPKKKELKETNPQSLLLAFAKIS